MKNKTLLWVLPILFCVLISPFTPYIDLSIERFFYLPNHRFVNNAFFNFMYDYAIYPSWMLFLPATIVLVLSYFKSSLKKWRPFALYLIVVLTIGAGFIAHAGLKEHWGRPRPKQVIEFGGKQEFRPFYRPNFFNQPEPSKSFVCGHCTIGFYFFALVFIGYRLKRKWITYLGWFIGIGLGIGLGITRMAQGGHFFSDVLFCALVMWLTSLIGDWLILEEAE
jgi:lipid A 4'-phosphatase